MLASVASPQEAEIALAEGADIIDCKDPARGALAALAQDRIAAIVATVAGRKPVSAVVELPHDIAHARPALEALAACVDFIKLALPATPDAHEIIATLAPLTKKTRLVAVLFADLSPEFDMLEGLAQAGFAGAMLDTAQKGKGRLLDHMSLNAIADFTARCRSLSLLSGLAGSLEAPDVPRLLIFEPDLLGFRGALCSGKDRRAPLDANATRLIRELMPSGAKPIAPSSAREVVDHVFVRDLVLPMRIGAYGFEHGHEQRVRFTVDVEVVTSFGPDDMRSVFSYDVVMDAIKMILAGGHIELVETIAERIAAVVLRHERVRSVSVEVEKLDVAPGSVGVRIVRTNP